jgi:hypothetical protein
VFGSKVNLSHGVRGRIPGNHNIPLPTFESVIPMSFPKNVCPVTVDSAHYRVVDDVEITMDSWCFFFRSLRGVGPYGLEAESHGLVTSSAAAMRGKAPPPCSRLRKASAGQGLPHPQLRK